MGIMTVGVRLMTEGDLVGVAAIEAESQPNPWSEKVFRDELVAPGRVYLVAEEERVVGFGGAMVVEGDAHITNLVVRAESRGLGIGTRLVAGLIEAALDMGAANLTLEVRSRNQEARRLYSRFGMAPVGVRKGYYGDDDALIMWAHEIDSASYREKIEAMR